MPELPEVTNLARQIHMHLSGKTIEHIDVLQPKCLNVPLEQFTSALTGATLLRSQNRGKWIVTETDHGWLLLNLGMGGELLLVTPDTLPEKRRLVFHFRDGTCLSVNFWWFGYAHWAPPGGLNQHEMVAKLGQNALDLNREDFRQLMARQRGRLKTFLLDQTHLAGIGNAYIHDILFFARLHPLRKIDSLTNEEVDRLFDAIQAGLRPSLEIGGAFYEVDLFGKKGGFTMDDVRIGYREGQPCPTCSTLIVKIKTGGTSSFICPSCQVE